MLKKRKTKTTNKIFGKKTTTRNVIFCCSFCKKIQFSLSFPLALKQKISVHLGKGSGKEMGRDEFKGKRKKESF